MMRAVVLRDKRHASGFQRITVSSGHNSAHDGAEVRCRIFGWLAIGRSRTLSEQRYSETKDCRYEQKTPHRDL
jgi:hypothetical protein